ncbi:hypothetical protein H9L19_00085 [Weissella diestrammenae]|uniref:TraX protein n=1 Tax=Weissella diestrammenae TaxID=1162633 RepID=A0A7G9T5G9_9LACO|nr:TraX family protein [Weissella diestrammenae]MCM0583205.1 hypothetical protein [Weissella diestrammenae]QNN75344.1 hypothetical protein H9L19_00085 [Weissella diestrammenae]
MQNKQGMNGFQIKITGLISMVFDHIGEFFSFPIIFHWIGRLAAPIFLFESSEGFIHTRNRKKYMLRLLYGFWLMGIIDFVLSRYFSIGDTIVVNNIFGTLFLGTVYMTAISYFKGDRVQRSIVRGIAWFMVPILLGIGSLDLINIVGSNEIFLQLVLGWNILVPNILLVEGGFLLVALAVLFYIFHGNKMAQIASLFVVAAFSLIGKDFGQLFGNNYQWMMILAALPILWYNGEKGKNMRNFFYIFYPAHIIVLAVLAYYLH